MPIKGFNSITEQTISAVETMYGQLSQSPRHLYNKKYSIDSKKFIPYLCDKTGQEFSISWDTLRRNLNEPHYAEYLEYTEEEVKFLKENYPKRGRNFCALFLKRPKNSITAKAHEIGIKRYKPLIPEGYKKCSRCQQILPVEQFNKKEKDTNKLQCNCRKCASKSKGEYFVRLKSDKDRRKINCIKGILRSAKKRARKKGMEYNISLDWVLENTPQKCPIFNTEFEFLANTKGGNDRSFSLDRVNNNWGYIENNVIPVSKKANSIKRDATPDELYKVSTFYNNLNQEKIEYMI